MSQENVDVVRGRVWDGIDAVPLVRDDAAFTEWRAENDAFYEPDCAFAWMAFGQQLEATGLDEARQTWLDFFEPWQSVQSKVERLIPAGDKVVALMRQRGRMAGARNEVQLIGAAVYLVRDGRIARAEFYARRAAALEAVGLRDDGLPHESVESESPTTELQALDRRGTAMFTLAGKELGCWMLTQGGRPVGLIRRVDGGHSLRTASEGWDGFIRKRGRVGWQLEFARTGESQTAIYYVPRGLLQGGLLDEPSRGRRYKLRAPVLRENWRLTGAAGAESVQIAFRNGGPVPAFRRHVQLDADLADEPLLAGVILASSVAIVVHFEQPRVITGG